MIIDLVDSLEYTTTNCFAHQLHKKLSQFANVKTVELKNLSNIDFKNCELVVSRLKQRTLFRELSRISVFLKDTPIVIYDQDPWEAFRKTSPYHGTYKACRDGLNVQFFAVTTRWWQEYLSKSGYSSQFVKMWVLPEYTLSEVTTASRRTQLGFLGTLHSHRKKLFNELTNDNIDVICKTSTLGYAAYLQALSKIECFIHSENSPIEMFDQNANMNYGLWVKEIEAMSQGCFCIRDKGLDSESYLENTKTVFLYDNVSEVKDIVKNLNNLSEKEKIEMLNESIQFVRSKDVWGETANILLLNKGII